VGQVEVRAAVQVLELLDAVVAEQGVPPQVEVVDRRVRRREDREVA